MPCELMRLFHVPIVLIRIYNKDNGSHQDENLAYSPGVTASRTCSPFQIIFQTILFLPSRTDLFVVARLGGIDEPCLYQPLLMTVDDVRRELLISLNHALFYSGTATLAPCINPCLSLSSHASHVFVETSRSVLVILCSSALALLLRPAADSLRTKTPFCVICAIKMKRFKSRRQLMRIDTILRHVCTQHHTSQKLQVAYAHRCVICALKIKAFKD